MTRLEPLNSIGNFYAKAGPSPDRPRPLRLAMAKGGETPRGLGV